MYNTIHAHTHTVYNIVLVYSCTYIEWYNIHDVLIVQRQNSFTIVIVSKQSN